MIYPAYVHLGDAYHAHGVTIPDFPGCFSAADAWDLLPNAIQEAIELYCEGEDMDIPAPSPMKKLIANPDYAGGVWMLIDVDVSRLSTKPMRINISLPENLVQSIDRYVKTHHLTRSGFLAKAALAEIQKAGSL
ncbi:MAG: type II toxin-antitoxin system HicB family antitoxin [Methylobacter sp.]|nr:type II toxin-antitoxin system HicB family antitoxin [Methylobacter sp.]